MRDADKEMRDADRIVLFFFFSSRRRHTRFDCDWSSDVCSSDLGRGRVVLTATSATQLAWEGDEPTSPSIFTRYLVRGLKTGEADSNKDGSITVRSEERRVGKECRSRWSPYH